MTIEGFYQAQAQAGGGARSIRGTRTVFPIFTSSSSGSNDITGSDHTVSLAGESSQRDATITDNDEDSGNRHMTAGINRRGVVIEMTSQGVGATENREEREFKDDVSIVSALSTPFEMQDQKSLLDREQNDPINTDSSSASTIRSTPTTDEASVTLEVQSPVASSFLPHQHPTGRVGLNNGALSSLPPLSNPLPSQGRLSTRSPRQVSRSPLHSRNNHETHEL